MALQKQASQGDDRFFVTVKNVEASSLTTGYAVSIRVGTAASFNGINAVQADSDNASDLFGFLGVSTQDIVSNGFGLVQIGGNCLSVFISNVGTSLTINSGDPCVPGKGAGGVFSQLPTFANSGGRFILASNTPLAVSAASYMSGWIHY